MTNARVASALKTILRVEILIAIGFVIGCVYAGLTIGFLD